MSYENYFPKGIAAGSAFCDREDERAILQRNIKQGLHTLIMSPRRYGKTSLVKYVVKEIGITYGEADFFVAIDAKQVERQILEGIKQIIKGICTPLEQGLKIISDYFQKISARWVIGTEGVNVALIPDDTTDVATNILNGLQALENLLAKKQTQAVLFLDEVQILSEIAEGKGIEGAIRHVLQQSKFLSLIFSGSNRHLLRTLFYDKARPLYKLCDRILLNRIAGAHYQKHLNSLAIETWQTSLEDAVLNRIFAITELHPFYMNALCLEVWGLCANKSKPTLNDVEFCWKKLIADERLEVMRELSMLGVGQRKILLAMAEKQQLELTGKEFLQKVNMTGSSVHEAIKVLEQKDYIERHENAACSIIDPLIKNSLILYFG